MEHAFLCESEEAKLAFLMEAFPDAKHVFTDIVDVAKGTACDRKLGDSWTAVPKVRGK